MISRRFRAALLMLNTSAGYCPVAAFRCLNPRTLLCAAPFTVNADVCSGNDVGMPELRWCVCQLVSGSHGTCGAVRIEFHGTVKVYDGFWAPDCVSNSPTMSGLSQVWLSGSGRFFGKSYVRSAS